MKEKGTEYRVSVRVDNGHTWLCILICSVSCMFFGTGFKLLMLTVASASACHSVADSISPVRLGTIRQSSLLVEACCSTSVCSLLCGSFIVAIALIHSDSKRHAESRTNFRALGQIWTGMGDGFRPCTDPSGVHVQLRVCISIQWAWYCTVYPYDGVDIALYIHMMVCLWHCTSVRWCACMKLYIRTMG